MTEGRRSTVFDVARLAGVSTATVSRALTGAKRVNPETLQRVRQAADALDYHVDQVGRSLRQQKSGTVGLVVASITNPFFPLLVQAVESAVRDSDLGLLLADAQDDPAVEREVLQLLLDRRVDAILIAPCHRLRSRQVVADAAAKVPVVQLDRIASRSAHFVGADQRGAIGQLLGHLSAQGRERVVMLGSADSESTAWERRRAFSDLAESLSPGAGKRVLPGHFSVEWGRAGALEALRRWPGLDALLCANDGIALGALQALQRSGIKVPGDVAVTGFDDTLLALVSDPPLTSVSQPLSQMAEAAVALIGDEHGSRSERIRLAARLEPRASSVGP